MKPTALNNVCLPLAMCLLVGCCSPPTPTNVPAIPMAPTLTPDVTYENGRVLAASATILSRSQLYDGQADVAPESLVGIEKSGQYYLYHPSLGATALDAQTSRRALGAFVLGLRAATSAMSNSTLGQRTQALWLTCGGTTIPTGLGVADSGGTVVTLSNQKKRWAEVTGAGAPVFLQPRSLVELNLLNALRSKNPLQVFASDSADLGVVPGGTVQTYGAVIRAWPALLDPQLPASTDLYVSAKAALDRDSDAFGRLNAVEFATLAVEVVEQIVGVVDISSCVSPLANGVIDAFKIIGLDILTKDRQLQNKLADQLSNSVLDGYITCVSGAVSAGVCAGVTAGAGAIPCAGLKVLVSEAINLLGAAAWLVDNSVAGSVDALSCQAYADWQRPQRQVCIDNTQCSGHGTCDTSGASNSCKCATGYTGSTCNACAAGYSGYPTCTHIPPADLGSMQALAGYYIDKTEVSAGDFARCLDTGACSSGSVQTHICMGSDASYYRCNVRAPGRELFPANCVTGSGAQAYCQSVGKRLCTVAEWQAACMGSSKTTYPWGNGFYDIGANPECTCNLDGHGGSRCSNRTHGNATTCAQSASSGVITCPGCAYFHPTNSGECRFNNLADMIGNVAEWVLAADGTFQKRGGSAGSTFNATCTSTSFAGFGSASDGLRCCWSP